MSVELVPDNTVAEEERTDTCRDCGERFPISLLKKAARKKKGYVRYCRSCASKRQRGYKRARIARCPFKYKGARLLDGLKARSTQRKMVLDTSLNDMSLWADVARFVTRCECCRKEFVVKTEITGGKMGGSAHSLTIDCINPDLGYIEGNVAALCLECNSEKRLYGSKKVAHIYRWADERLAVAA